MVNVTWTTNEVTDSHLCVRKTGTSTWSMAGDLEYTQSHSVVIANLDAATEYQVMVDSSDVAGNATIAAPVLFDNVVTPAFGVEVTQSGTQLSWTVDYEDSVVSYQIVNAMTNQIIATVAARGGSGNNYAINLPAGVTANIIAIDASGYKQTFSVVDGSQVQVVYHLKQGWNLLAAFGEDSQLDQLKETTSGPLWIWTGNSYEAVEIPTVTQGYWVYADQAVDVTVSATKVEADINLQNGWNLVGPTGNTTLPGEANTAFGWDNTYHRILNDGYLIQGIGYWLYKE